MNCEIVGNWPITGFDMRDRRFPELADPARFTLDDAGHGAGHGDVEFSASHLDRNLEYGRRHRRALRRWPRRRRDRPATRPGHALRPTLRPEEPARHVPSDAVKFPIGVSRDEAEDISPNELLSST